ncbi:MAG: hypothetical protein HFI38_08485 [Lachnospiraceae bacterium]|jgi:LCP family protein required for cell wall assembly|nr:hypothetical protein [Lachnospiraceae bacterium]
MDREMDQELELQIGQGLEQFLEREMDGLAEAGAIPGWQAPQRETKGPEQGEGLQRPETGAGRQRPDPEARMQKPESGGRAQEPQPGKRIPRQESVEKGRHEIRTDMLPPSSRRRTVQANMAGRESAAREPSSRKPSPQKAAVQSGSVKRAARPAGKEETALRQKAKKRYEEEDEDIRRRSSWEEDEDYEEEEEYEEEKPKRPRRRKRRRSRLRRLLVFLLIVALLVVGLWHWAVGKVYGKMNYSPVESLTNEPMKEDGVINILLIGNDSRSQGEDGRSDAMILLSISSRTKTIHIMSLLRDMYVDIPGREGNRLNAAYAFGGPELLMETLKQNLDLEVNRYIQVNFQAFANLVDAVGGVDLELSNDEVGYVNGYLTEYNNLEGRPEGTDYLDSAASGMLHLNGPQALAYCRIRYIGSDFGRTERQRKVLSEVMRRAPKALLTNPFTFINNLLPNLTTNLTEAECRQLSLQIFRLAGYETVSSSIPVPGSYSNASIGGKSVLEVDFEVNKAFIRQNIYGEE